MIELPVNIAYKIDAGNGKVVVAAGPYASWHIKKYNISFTDDLGNPIQDVPLYKSINYGVNGNIGYEWNSGPFVRLNFQRVITGMYSNEPMGVTGVPISTVYLATYNYGITTGYLFKSAKKKRTETAPGNDKNSNT